MSSNPAQPTTTFSQPALDLSPTEPLFVTRETLLKCVQVFALVCGLVANTVGDNPVYGLSDTAVHWISLLALVGNAVAGAFSGPFFKKTDGEFVTPPKD
jgi:hypothetical protein